MKTEQETPHRLAVFDPENLPYEKQYLCLCLPELLEEAEHREVMEKEEGSGES